ncbi:hypothetical protein [Streptococcus symci]|uniref:Uncharacterized protein n=1 Tax=Streptococcus symci TaxID=2588991 RepID=A0A501P7U4_9STRE|nr:hypothetical protein [Streptococcus symci]TPD56393.1 hypothetical protein FJN11_08735 [Streptococcus symci]
MIEEHYHHGIFSWNLATEIQESEEFIVLKFKKFKTEIFNIIIKKERISVILSFFIMCRLVRLAPLGARQKTTRYAGGHDYIFIKKLFFLLC